MGTATAETMLSTEGSHIRLTAVAGAAGIGVLPLEIMEGAKPEVVEDPEGSGNFFLRF